MENTSRNHLNPLKNTLAYTKISANCPINLYDFIPLRHFLSDNHLKSTRKIHKNGCSSIKRQYLLAWCALLDSTHVKQVALHLRDVTSWCALPDSTQEKQALKPFRTFKQFLYKIQKLCSFCPIDDFMVY